MLRKILRVTVFILGFVSLGLFLINISITNSKTAENFFTSNLNQVGILNNEKTETKEEVKKEIHIKKPEHVKGIYMSSWVAGTEAIRNRLTKLADDTEINAVVIDFKDSTGIVSTPAGENASIDRKNSASKRVVDLPEYIEELHSKGIYTIARIAVFEDPVYSKNHKNLSVQNSNGNLWVDRHGLSWVDPSSVEFHQYILDLANEAYEIGFDEINFDYIRFPTDGSKDKIFPITKNNSQQMTITNFSKYMYTELSAKNIPISLDVFGQIVSTQDDMGIGQYYEDLLLYSNVIAPMIYPSHFYAGYKNIKSPVKSPYETVSLSMQDAIKRRELINSNTEIRPWLQDFSLDGVNYDASMVRAQIKALEDLGLHSWLLWDPKNKYTTDALVKVTD